MTADAPAPAPPATATAMRLGYDKRLMLFAGRANPAPAEAIARELGGELGPVTLQTFSTYAERREEITR